MASKNVRLRGTYSGDYRTRVQAQPYTTQWPGHRYDLCLVGQRRPASARSLLMAERLGSGKPKRTETAPNEGSRRIETAATRPASVPLLLLAGPCLRRRTAAATNYVRAWPPVTRGRTSRAVASRHGTLAHSATCVIGKEHGRMGRDF